MDVFQDVVNRDRIKPSIRVTDLQQIALFDVFKRKAIPGEFSRLGRELSAVNFMATIPEGCERKPAATSNIQNSRRPLKHTVDFSGTSDPEPTHGPVRNRCAETIGPLLVKPDFIEGRDR